MVPNLHMDTECICGECLVALPEDAREALPPLPEGASGGDPDHVWQPTSYRLEVCGASPCSEGIHQVN